MYSEKSRSYQGEKSTKIKNIFLHLDRRKKCTESPVYSLEREKVRNLVQTFGVDIKQVLPYVFENKKL